MGAGGIRPGDLIVGGLATAACNRGSDSDVVGGHGERRTAENLGSHIRTICILSHNVLHGTAANEAQCGGLALLQHQAVMGGGDGDAFVTGDEVAWLQFFTEVPAAVITGSRHNHSGESAATIKDTVAKCRCRATLHIERRQAGAATKGPIIDSCHAGREGQRR